jgi:transposase
MRLRELPRLLADETTAPVLDPGRGRTKTGQLWAYAAGDRPWSGSDPSGVAYVYAPDRKAKRLIAHLEGALCSLRESRKALERLAVNYRPDHELAV